MVTSGNDWEEAWKAGNILYVDEVDGDAGVHPQKSFLEPSAEDQCPGFSSLNEYDLFIKK